MRRTLRSSFQRQFADLHGHRVADAVFEIRAEPSQPLTPSRGAMVAVVVSASCLCAAAVAVLIVEVAGAALFISALFGS